MNKKIGAVLLLILLFFLLHAVSYNFIQDDAFISYRYVKNLVSGRGLVFNTGERVEGYTNFLWIILLALFTTLGLNTVAASKFLGLASGCLSLLLLYRIARILLRGEGVEWKRTEDRERERRKQDQENQEGQKGGKARPGPADWLALAPPLLLAANGAFAYWCISGLESGLFVLMILAATYFYFTRERLMVPFGALATLVRPEGALVFAVFLLDKVLFRRDGLKNGLRFAAAYAVLLLPYLIFKVAYYGDLLPNPFYAKTGFSWEYVRSGLGYFWRFLRHYGLWGGLYLLTLIGWRRTPVGRENSTWVRRPALLMIWIYSLAVILIGGDVLQGHRFFLPVLPFLYLFIGWGLLRLRCAVTSEPLRRWLPAAALAALLSVTFFLPRPWLLTVRRAEIGLGRKMADTAARLNALFDGSFTMAASTIGALSYYSEATVIDMLGLTDPMIARHPEEIPGIASPWKERNYNGRYLLSRDPDVIIFSTGMKPSAPAERALLLYSEFRDHYYPYYLPRGDLLQVVFRRKPGDPAANRLFPDAAFANLFNQVMSLESRGLLALAAEKTEEIIAVGPPDFSWAYDRMASLHFLMKNQAEAERFARQAVGMDDYCVLSHYILKALYLARGDSAAAGEEHDKILRYNPEFLQLNADERYRP